MIFGLGIPKPYKVYLFEEDFKHSTIFARCFPFPVSHDCLHFYVALDPYADFFLKTTSKYIPQDCAVLAGKLNVLNVFRSSRRRSAGRSGIYLSPDERQNSLIDHDTLQASLAKIANNGMTL